MKLEVTLRKRVNSFNFFFDYSAEMDSAEVLNHPFYGGAVGLNEQEVKDRAVFEVLERYGSSVVEKKVESFSINDLKRSGRNFLDPRELAQFSKAQYQVSSFPYVYISSFDKLDWVESDNQVLLPARAVYFGYSKNRQSKILPSITCGTAIHKTVLDAKFCAIAELVERHQAMTSWISRDFGAQLDHASLIDEELQYLLKCCKKNSLNIYIFAKRSVFDLPFFCVVTEAENEPCAAFGISTGFDFESQIKKALLESLMVRNSLELISSFEQRHVSKMRDVKKFMDHSIFYGSSSNYDIWKFMKNTKMTPLSEMNLPIKDRKQFIADSESEVCVTNITPKAYQDLNLHLFRAVSCTLFPMNVRYDCQYLAREDYSKANSNLAPHPFG